MTRLRREVFHKGDRVRIDPNYSHVFRHAYAGTIGTVVAEPKGPNVAVTWDGNSAHTVGYYHRSFLERVEEASA